MASRISPYVDNTGLLFAYDLANVKRSYLGQPTTNYVTGDTDLQANIDCTSTNATDILPDGTVGTVRRITVTANTYNGIIRASLSHTLPSSGIPQAGVSYTISCWIRNSSGVAVAAGWEPEVGQPDGYLRPNIESGFKGDYNSNSQPNTLSSNWTKVSYTYSYNSTQTSQIVPFIYFGHPVGGSGAGVGATIDFYQIQLEIKSHATPYVNGTRSATQGLKDLTGRSTIDLTNVSFDSNAQMTFDGTDDYAALSGFVQPSNPNNFSVEAVVKLSSHNAGTNIGSVIVNNYSSLRGWIFFLNGPSSFLGLRHHNESNPGGYNVVYGTGINLNQWYHIAATDDGATVRLYINGVQVTSGSSGPSVNYAGQPIIGQFGGGNAVTNGSIPYVRIFDRALPASEIQQNFNAIKGRYGL